MGKDRLGTDAAGDGNTDVGILYNNGQASGGRNQAACGPSPAPGPASAARQEVGFCRRILELEHQQGRRR
ncbi:hypothetical protein [Streptomyces sp. NPDC055005]